MEWFLERGARTILLGEYLNTNMSHREPDAAHVK